MRTTISTVVFRRPFRLSGFDQAHAPGTFEVKTDEERLDTAFEGWHRVATTIRLVDRGRIQTWPVEPSDLDRAIAADIAGGAGL